MSRNVLAPTFSNAIAAELFDAKHTRGRFKVLCGTDSKFVVHETGCPNGKSERGRFTSVGQAHHRDRAAR